MTPAEWFASAVGAVGALFGGASWMDSRSERTEKRIAEIAVRAVEDSEKFAPSGTQGLINQQLSKDVAAISRTVDGIDAKLDQLFLTGRLHIQRKSDNEES